jgi:uncharacterized membrane protein required for colicin V production
MELFSVLKQFNWVDIFVIILLLRTSYIAVKNGLPAELFKTLGLISATYFSLHYYTFFSGLVDERPLLKSVPAELLNFISFVILALCGYFVFVILRKIFCRFIKVEAVPNLNKWGGFILGIFRVILLISLLIFMLAMSPVGYLTDSVKHSFSGKRIVQVAPAIYSSLWDKIASKFMTSEKFNKSVFEVQEGLDK